MHGCTPLDLASMPIDQKMVEILKKLGAHRKLSREPVIRPKGTNTFYFGAGVGGPDLPVEVERIHIQLTGLMHQWSGQCTNSVRVFGFVMFVDGSLTRYTETMNILGQQKAKRKRDWLEVRIGVPESWWREDEAHYKVRIIEALEDGFSSMIALLNRNEHAVDESSLMRDWNHLKIEFLNAPARPFAAEAQRARMTSLVNEAVRAIEARDRRGITKSSEYPRSGK
jgi:hypothetical protein